MTSSPRNPPSSSSWLALFLTPGSVPLLEIYFREILLDPYFLPLVPVCVSLVSVSLLFPEPSVATDKLVLSSEYSTIADSFLVSVYS